MEVPVAFDDFLRFAFGLELTEGWRGKSEDWKKASEEEEFVRLLGDYGKELKTDSETASYKPFADLANHVMKHFNASKEVVFCRNDPTIIRGSSAERKPDVTVVHQKSTKEEFLIKPFLWTKILSFFEFKKTKYVAIGEQDDTSTIQSGSNSGTGMSDYPPGSSVFTNMICRSNGFKATTEWPSIIRPSTKEAQTYLRRFTCAVRQLRARNVIKWGLSELCHCWSCHQFPD